VLRRCALLFCLLVLAVGGAEAATRVALVVGNGAYRAAPPLANPLNDARALAAALERSGFAVILATDLDKAGFDAAILAFGKALKGAEVGLFFYAGHGMQVAGTNYLLPVDAELADEVDLYLRTIDLDLVTGLMEQSVETALVILDACRDNPMAQTLARSLGTRSSSVGRGLAQVDAGLGTLIAYATQPGNVALDGSGGHSPFAAALLQHIETPGVEINVLMTRVRLNVIEATDRQQHPWVHTSLLGEFYFVEQQAAAAPAPSPAPTPAPADDRQAEIVFWQSIQDSTDWRDFQAYIDRFGPEGIYHDLALRRMQKLKAEEDGATAEAAPATEAPVDLRAFIKEQAPKERDIYSQPVLDAGSILTDLKAWLGTEADPIRLHDQQGTVGAFDGRWGYPVAVHEVDLPEPGAYAFQAISQSDKPIYMALVQNGKVVVYDFAGESFAYAAADFEAAGKIKVAVAADEAGEIYDLQGFYWNYAMVPPPSESMPTAIPSSVSDQADVLLWKATAYSGNDPPRNYSTLSEEIDRDSSDAAVYIERALALALQGDYWAALDDLNAAEMLAPHRLDMLLLRATLYRLLELPELAGGDIELLAALAPENASVYLERGCLRAQMGDTAGARQDWTRALKLDPAGLVGQAAHNRLRLVDSQSGG